MEAHTFFHTVFNTRECQDSASLKEHVKLEVSAYNKVSGLRPARPVGAALVVFKRQPEDASTLAVEQAVELICFFSFPVAPMLLEGR